MDFKPGARGASAHTPKSEGKPVGGGGGKTAPFSDPDFDGKEPVEVIQTMSRAKRWLEARGYSITLRGEYCEVKVKQVKF